MARVLAQLEDMGVGFKNLDLRLSLGAEMLPRDEPLVRRVGNDLFLATISCCPIFLSRPIILILIYTMKPTLDRRTVGLMEVSNLADRVKRVHDAFQRGRSLRKLECKPGFRLCLV